MSVLHEGEHIKRCCPPVCLFRAYPQIKNGKSQKVQISYFAGVRLSVVKHKLNNIGARTVPRGRPFGCLRQELHTSAPVCIGKGRFLNPLKPSVITRLHFECSAPYSPNQPFLISDTRALWRSGLSARVPECQKLKTVG